MTVRVVLAAVMSVDGKMTKWGDPNVRLWSSKEDQGHLSALVRKHQVIVMGRKTYLAVRANISMPNDKLRLIMTRSPEAYRSTEVPGMLEYTDASPEALLRTLERRGYADVLLAGGAEINSLFLQAGCVDEIWLTLEPRLFGTGHGLTAAEELDVHLELISTERLNEGGTLLLKYRVSGVRPV